MRIIYASAFAFTLLFSGCSKAMNSPDIKQNPHPVQRYEVTMTIEGAPGPFDSVTGYAVYQVLNDECVPLTPISGARLAPEKSIPLTFTQTGNTYKSTFYADQLLDENYYGHGVCHWTLTGAGALLNLRKIVFSSSISSGDINSQKSSVTYFAKTSYHDLNEEGGNTGTVRTEYVTQNPSNFFSVTIVTKEGTK